MEDIFCTWNRKRLLEKERKEEETVKAIYSNLGKALVVKLRDLCFQRKAMCVICWQSGLLRRINFRLSRSKEAEGSGGYGLVQRMLKLGSEGLGFMAQHHCFTAVQPSVIDSASLNCSFPFYKIGIILPGFCMMCKYTDEFIGRGLLCNPSSRAVQENFL